jgi:ABC-2 type transport system permease protein
MKTAWYIARKDLLQAIKDRNSIILLLLVPVVLMAAIGAALGGIYGSSGPIQITVAVSNQDSGFSGENVGKTITQALTINNQQLQINIQRYSSSSQVATVVADTKGNVNAGVVIPANTTKTLIQAAVNNKPTSDLVKFYALPNNNNGDARISIIQSLVTNVVNQLVTAQFSGMAAVRQVEGICNQPGNHCSQQTINPATIAQIVGTSGANATQQAQVAQLTAGQTVKVGTFDETVPGYAIFFALFSINAVAATILQEKEDGTFRRLLIAPIQKYSLLVGKMIAQFLLTLLQLTILFSIGYFVFHVHLGNIPAVILLLLGTSFAATGLGILLVSVVKSRRQLPPVVTLVTLISAAIGGSWWPLWIEPTWMQSLARLGITAWAMDGLNNVIIYGKDLIYILPDVLGLFGYGLICFIVALRFFRFQEKAA